MTNETAMLILRLGRSQERMRQIMNDLEFFNCSKHNSYWDEAGEIGDKLDDVRRHLSAIYEKMADLHNCLWDDDE